MIEWSREILNDINTGFLIQAFDARDSLLNSNNRGLDMKVTEWEAFKAQGIPGRLEAARLGKNPTVVARVPSGWAVLGDSQLLEGYSLIVADPIVSCLNDLSLETQLQFMRDVVLLGRAIQDVTGCARVNYGIYGNTDPFLPAHVRQIRLGRA